MKADAVVAIDFPGTRTSAQQPESSTVQSLVLNASMRFGALPSGPLAADELIEAGDRR